MHVRLYYWLLATCKSLGGTRRLILRRTLKGVGVAGESNMKRVGQREDLYYARYIGDMFERAILLENGKSSMPLQLSTENK